MKEPKQADLHAAAEKEMKVVCRLMDGQTIMALLSQQQMLRTVMENVGKEAIDTLRKVNEMEG